MGTKILVTGRRGRGKDSLAAAVRQLRPEVERHAFADPLKQDVCDQVNLILGRCEWPRDPLTIEEINANKHIYGPWLQHYGTDVMRAADPEIWVKRWHSQWGHLGDVVVPDYRFPNEAEYGVLHGFVLVRVVGPNRQSSDTSRSDDHESERLIDGLPCDLTFVNDRSLDELFWWVKHELLPYVDAMQQVAA